MVHGNHTAKLARQEAVKPLNELVVHVAVVGANAQQQRSCHGRDMQQPLDEGSADADDLVVAARRQDGQMVGHGAQDGVEVATMEGQTHGSKTTLLVSVLPMCCPAEPTARCSYRSRQARNGSMMPASSSCTCHRKLRM